MSMIFDTLLQDVDLKALERSPLEAERQKRRLYEINVVLLEVDKQPYGKTEFSTVLTFNYLTRPVKNPLKMILLGFVELDDFVKQDTAGLYTEFAHRYRRHLKRLKKP